MQSQGSDPRVAAIIATMNRQEYVRDAVTSACEQTYDAMEIVVVDGSDDDRTERVIEELRQAYPDIPITYFHNNTPQGLPAARNQGIAATDAEYLAFLDDDDEWYPEKTSRQMSLFRSGADDLALVHSGYIGRYDDGRRKLTYTPEYDSSPYPELLERNVIRTPSSVVVRRGPFEAVGGFDEMFRYCEDWDLYLRLARDYRFEYIPEPLVDRLYHDEAMIQNLEQLFKYRKQIFEKHDDQLQQHGMVNQAWASHYELVGSRYLQARKRSRARTAYRAAWSRTRDPNFAVLCIVLYVLPIRLALPTIHALSEVKNRTKPYLRTILRSPSG